MFGLPANQSEHVVILGVNAIIMKKIITPDAPTAISCLLLGFQSVFPFTKHHDVI